MLKTKELKLEGVRLIFPQRFQDERGFFSEVYNKGALGELGLHDDFVQDNHSMTREPGTVRGLHYQIEPYPTTKLVRVTKGAILDVVVDIRSGSPTYGHHVAEELSEENWAQMYVPIGFAHGFCTLTPDTEVAYKVSAHWSPDVDRGLAWDDPDLGIDWPVDPGRAIVSEKDRHHPRLRELPRSFSWEGA